MRGTRSSVPREPALVVLLRDQHEQIRTLNGRRPAREHPPKLPRNPDSDAEGDPYADSLVGGREVLWDFSRVYLGDRQRVSGRR